MEKLIKLLVFIFISIVLPILADIISNFITMDSIMKCVYFILRLAMIKKITKESFKLFRKGNIDKWKIKT